MEKGFVHYCCVAKGGKILQAYNGGDHEIEKLAILCIEKAPLNHSWYSQSINGRTFFFLMEDGFIYFAIAKEGIGNSALFQFLSNVRNEFKKITKKGSNRKGGSFSSNSNFNLQEQLIPIITQLITSLQNVSQTGANRKDEVRLNLSSSPCNGYYRDVVEGSTSPLLGIGMRGIELEEGHRVDLGLKNSCSSISSMELHNDLSTSMKTRSQRIKRKWCRLVWLVLVIDAFICIVLFLVWLRVCQGFQCVR